MRDPYALILPLTLALNLTLTLTLTLTLGLILTLTLTRARWAKLVKDISPISPPDLPYTRWAELVKDTSPIPRLDLAYTRWAKLVKDFYKPKKDTFDTTKVPDLYDNALYDMVHNRHLELGSLPEVYAEARTLASYVVPQVSSGQ